LPRTPVLIAELPHLLRDILIDSIADLPDLGVVGVVEPGGSIERAVHRTGASVVVVGAGASTRAARTRLLERGAEAPGLLVLTRDGRAAVVELALGDLSPDGLIDAIRRMAELRAGLAGPR
jgi:hypothetical protein